MLVRNVPLSCAFWAIHWFLFDSMTSFSRRMWSSKFRKKVNILALTSSCDTLIAGGIHCVVASVIWQRRAINNAFAKGSERFSNQDASKRDLGDIETWPVEPLISRARDTAGVGLAVSKQASFNITSCWYLLQALVILHFHDSKETYQLLICTIDSNCYLFFSLVSKPLSIYSVNWSYHSYGHDSRAQGRSVAQ